MFVIAGVALNVLCFFSWAHFNTRFARIITKQGWPGSETRAYVSQHAWQYSSQKVVIR